MASQKCFQNGHSLMEGMELKLCFVMSLMSWTLLDFCISESLMGKVLDLNTNLTVFYLGNSHGISLLFGGHYLPVNFICFSNCGLATCDSKVPNLGTMSFFNGSQQGLKENFGKEFCTSAQILQVYKEFFFRFYKPFSYKFWILGNLKVETLDFGFPLKFTMNLKPKQFQIFRISWASDAMSFISEIFSNRSTIMNSKKNSDVTIPISPQCLVQFVWNFGMFILYYINTFDR